MLGFQPRLIVIGRCIVTIRDSQKRAVAKYNAANYDRVELRLEKRSEGCCNGPCRGPVREPERLC